GATGHQGCGRTTRGGEDEGDGLGTILGGERAGSARRHDHIDLELHELRGKAGKPFDLSLRPPGLDHDGLALDVTEIAQGLPEHVEARSRVCESAGSEVADAEDFARLLRMAGGGEIEQAGDQGHREHKPRSGHTPPVWLGSASRQHRGCSWRKPVRRPPTAGSFSLTGPGGRGYTESTLRCL